MLKKILFISFIFKGIFLFSQHLPDSFAPRGMGGGGALFFPTINPVDDNEFYVSCDMSEMFHTIDFGKSYTQLHHKSLQAFNVSTYEFTYNNLIAYSIYNDGNDGMPVKTIDGGTKWNFLPGHDLGYGKPYKIMANYNNPSQVIVGYYGAIYISNNGGTTFNLIKQASNNGVGIILAGAFFDGANITVATNEGLFTSSDNGATFAPFATTGMTAGQVIWNFKGAINGGVKRYVCIASVGASTYNGLMPWDYSGHAKQVYTMDNNSGTWLAKSAGINFTNDFVMYVGMSENDVNTIYLGGNDNALGAPLVYKSADGGASWNKVFKSSGNQNIVTGWSGSGGDKGWSWGETCFGITVAPNNSQKVIFPDYSFVHVSSDGGANWTQAYVDTLDEHPANAATPTKKSYHSIGLENTTSWQLHWTDSNNVFGAFSDIGAIRSKDGGKSWGYQFNGLSVNSAYRYANAGNNLFVGTSNIHDIYQSTRLKDAQLDAADAQGKIYYSSDKGDNWFVMHVFGHPVFWVAADPNNSNILYASVVHFGGGGANMKGGIYKTTNAGALDFALFTQLPAPPRTEGHPASINVLNDGKVLCTFSARYTSNFTPSSGVFLYDPVTSTWEDKSDINMQYWTKDLVIDPNDPTQSTWYVGVFSGWGGSANGKGGLYKTTNRGGSWTKVIPGTLYERISSLTFNPSNKKQIFVTTETQGLLVCNDVDRIGPIFSLVDNYNFRQPERVFFNPYKPSEIWVTSFGNGLKVSTIKIDMTSDLSPVLNEENKLLVYPNPAKEVFNIESITKIETISIADMMGKEQNVNFYKMSDYNYQVIVTGLIKGIYAVKVNSKYFKVVVE